MFYIMSQQAYQEHELTKFKDGDAFCQYLARRPCDTVTQFRNGTAHTQHTRKIPQTAISADIVTVMIAIYFNNTKLVIYYNFFFQIRTI